MHTLEGFLFSFLLPFLIDFSLFNSSLFVPCIGVKVIIYVLKGMNELGLSARLLDSVLYVP